MSERSELLARVLRENPNDAFARYGLAMEFTNAGDVEAALGEFTKLIELHPDYSAGYFMAAQMLAKAGRNEEARRFLEGGIAAAARTGNAHAQGEMQAMLDEMTA